MDEQDKTRPIELPTPPNKAPRPEPETPLPPIVIQPDAPHREAAAVDVGPSPPIAARPATPSQQEVMFVPLAVSIGDGFKFGCGFFLAMVIAGLVGFVVLGLVVVLTGLFGLNLPLTR